MTGLKPRQGWILTGVLVLLFLLTRLLLFTSFPFSDNFLNIGMQLLDREELRGNLGEALLYQHSQPPLFNAFVGAVLKASPSDSAARRAFALLYAGMGLFLALGVMWLAQALGASPRWSFAAAALFLLWPPVIREQGFGHPPPEKWLSYDYPVMAMLMGMALCLARFAATRRTGWLAGFAALSGALALTRPFFHFLLWLGPVLALAWWAHRRERGESGWRRFPRSLALATALAVALTAGALGKNLLLTGQATLSTFSGMNLAGTTLFVPRQRVEELVADGVLTPLARLPRFSPPREYVAYYAARGVVSPPSGIAVLDRVEKGTGAPNFNHAVIPRASRETMRNVVALALAEPGAVLKAAANGLWLFFGFSPNQYLWPLGSPPWGFWQVAFPPVTVDGVPSFLRYAAAPLLFAAWYAAVALFLWRRRGEPLPQFLLFSLLYVLALSLLELGNNPVFRKQVDPFLFAGAAVLLTRLTPRWGQV